MENSIISVKSLGKRYLLGLGGGENYRALRDVMANTVKNLFRRSNENADPQELWALKDVTFDIREGEKVGIIGRNGAGKSTLLKILSEITEPSEGEAHINGRVASLLEVGTGFHPELTGKENIFMNGAILGMRRAEIKEKFDEIVAFAEITKLLDTPVKRYSSGMYVRLAFAVAANLEPEILMVDEVLAVGDIAFQKKCLGKMGEVAKGGRTVLFVSHNMGAIRSLCESAIWLDNGKILKMGNAGEVVSEYEKSQLRSWDKSAYIVKRKPKEVKNKPFYISCVTILNIEGEHANIFRYNDKLVLIVEYKGSLSGGQYSPEFRVYNELNEKVSTGASAAFHGKYFSQKVKKVRIEVGPLLLTSGNYRISLSVMIGSHRADTWENTIGFTISECQPFVIPQELLTRVEGVCVIDHSFSEAG